MSFKNLYQTLVTDNYAVIPNFLSPTDCARIRKDSKTFAYTAAQEVVGKRAVQQFFSTAEFILSKNPHLYSYGKVIGIQHRLASLLGVNIKFNDMHFQKYEPGKTGISPHADSPWFKKCIAVLLLEGESNFYLYENGYGANPLLVRAQIGDCILLRAPGIGDDSQGPYHGVANIQEQRLTLTLREKVLS